MNMYFLKDIVNRKKAHVTCDDVKTVFVPQYKNLSLERIFEFARQDARIVNYLPDEVDLPKVPKQWIVNVLAAVIGQPFKDWVA